MPEKEKKSFMARKTKKKKKKKKQIIRTIPAVTKMQPCSTHILAKAHAQRW